MADPQSTQSYVFESFSFDAATGELRRADRCIKLRPQVTQVLHLLLARQGQVVTRDELRNLLWPDERVVMFEASIAAVVRELRRALGDTGKPRRLIETVPKRGYRFLPQREPYESAAVRASLSSRSGARRRAASESLVRVGTGLAVLAALLLAGDTLRMPSTSPAIVEVLLFEDLTRRPGQDVIAAAVSAEVVGWLGPAVPAKLRVVDRTAAAIENERRSKEGRNADFLVHGSVRDDRDAMVVSARLLSPDGVFIWGEDYRRPADDTGLVAREVAARVAESVLSNVLPQWKEGGQAASAGKAVAAFNRGLEALALRGRDGTIGAVAAFREATKFAPGFAAAHSRLAETLIHWMGPPLTTRRVEQARWAALRAIDLDPANATGHRVLGEIGLYFDRDWQLAGRYLRRSVQLSPADAAGHHSHAAWLSARGFHDEALREIDLAGALDPASVTISFDVMLIKFYARKFGETVAAAKRLQKLVPGDEASHRYIVLSHLAMGDTVSAAGEARTRLAGATPSPDVMRSISKLSDRQAIKQYWSATFRVVSRHVRENSGDRALLSFLYVQLGEFDKAINELEAAVASLRFSYLLPYLGVSPAFDDMCGHPQFEAALRRLGQAALGKDSSLPRCAAAVRATGEQEESDRRYARTRR